MTFTTEFPDYPVADMPALPAGFIDLSWRNDMCPAFANPALGFAVWIDYADPAAREFEDGKRFTVYPCDAEGAHTEDESAFESDEWADVLAFILAETFARELKGELTPDQWEAMRRDNATPDYQGEGAPCDANLPMDAAFKAVTGREVDGDNEADCALWGAAWASAKARHLTAKALPYGGALDALATMFSEWAAREGFSPEDGDALELQMGDITPAQRAWLQAFCVMWDAEQSRLDSASREA